MTSARDELEREIANSLEEFVSLYETEERCLEFARFAVRRVVTACAEICDDEGRSWMDIDCVIEATTAAQCAELIRALARKPEET